MTPSNNTEVEMNVDSNEQLFNASKDPNYLKLVNALSELKSGGVDEFDPKFTTMLQIAKLYLINLNNNNNNSTNINNNNTNGNSHGEVVELFKAQVESFKYISRNLPIPVQVLQKMSPILENSPHVPSFSEELGNLKYYPKGLIKLDQNNNPITTNTMQYQQLCSTQHLQQQQQQLALQQQKLEQQEIEREIEEEQLSKLKEIEEQISILKETTATIGNSDSMDESNDNKQIQLQQLQFQQLQVKEKIKSISTTATSSSTSGESDGESNNIIITPSIKSVYKSTIPSSVENIKGLPEAIMLINERDLKIQAKVLTRIDELKEIPTHFLPIDVRIISEIESKQLRLLELQRKLRNDISLEMEDQVLIRSIQNNNDNDYDLYVRSIPRLVGKPIETLTSIYDGSGGVNQIPESVLTTNKKKFLEALLVHTREFKEFHIRNEKFLRQHVIKAIHRHHKEKERKEAQRLSEERIRLLKARDTEGYRDLLAKTKNERLEMLLGETDSLLSSIHQLMEKEQTEKREREIEQEKIEAAAAAVAAANPEISNTTNTTTTTTTTTSSQPIANITSPIQSTTTILPKKSNHLVIEQPDLMTGGKLKEYQVTGLEWLVSLYNRNLNGILADEMGLGKTVQTIAFISFLYERMNVREPFLVVAPLSTISNWVSEFARWSPKLHVIVYKGKQDERREIARQIPKNAFVVVITSFEYIIKDRKTLGKVHWIYIIIDEGHRIKNKNSKLSVQLRQYHSRNRLLLTGTPLQNDLSELWALLNFLLPTIFNSADTFQNWFNAPFQAKGKQLINVNEEESLIIINRLHQVLRFFLLRRLKSDVESQLPDKKEKVIKCNMSALQIAMYRSLAEYNVLPIDPDSKEGKSGRLKMKGFNNVVKQLQKVCNHPYLFKEEWDINEDLIRSSGKFDTMDQILMKMKESKHRVLIFTQMTEVINLMEEYFSLKEWGFLRLDGSTKPEERAHLVVEWNRPDSPYWIFVLSTHAGGLGMNLQTADTVIIFDSDWNPQMDLQAQDRCHRIGQTNLVSVFRLISANSIEEKILGRATDKLEIDAKIIQAGMFNTHSNDQERRAKLEQFLHGFPSNTLDEVPVDLKEINQLIARDEFEFKQFQEMDRIAKQKAGNHARPRLMIEKELPAWVLSTPSLDKEEDITGRKRTTAIASTKNFVHDNLTDNQYARMIEKGMTFEEYKQHLNSKKVKTNSKATNGKSKKGSKKASSRSGKGRNKGKSDDEEEDDDDQYGQLEDEGISDDDEQEQEEEVEKVKVVPSRRQTPQQRKQSRQSNNDEDGGHMNGTITTATTTRQINFIEEEIEEDDVQVDDHQPIVDDLPKKGRGRPRSASTTSSTTTTTTTTSTPLKRKLDEIKSPRSTRKSASSLMSESEMSENEGNVSNDQSDANHINGHGEPSENGHENPTPSKRGRKKKIRTNPEDEDDSTTVNETPTNHHVNNNTLNTPLSPESPFVTRSGRRISQINNN